MILKHFDVLDPQVTPAAVFKVGVMIRDGECSIVKWTVKESDPSKYVCHVIASMQDHHSEKMLAMFERYVHAWEQESKVLLERPIKLIRRQ